MLLRDVRKEEKVVQGLHCTVEMSWINTLFEEIWDSGFKVPGLMVTVGGQRCTFSFQWLALEHSKPKFLRGS